MARYLTPEVNSDWPLEVQEWIRQGVDLPGEVAVEIATATNSTPDSTLAGLYAALVSGPNRRVLGTFFTPHEEVSLMLDRWAANESAPATVVDIGAGVGVFTASSARMWPTAQIDAIDVNPITLGLLGARMTLDDVDEHSINVQLILDDYTTWIRNTTSPRPRLLLGNPPYTRWQLIPGEARERLARESEGYCGGRASLAAYITAVSLQHIGPRDGLCLLLPAQWLESNYARGMRQQLLDLRNRRVEVWLVKSAMFDDAMVDAVVLMVGTQRASSQPFTFAEWRGGSPEQIDRGTIGVDGWRTRYDSVLTTRARETINLGSFATVRRGVATGANKFFVLRDSDVEDRDLPPDVRRPLVYRLHPFDRTVTDRAFKALDEKDRRWLFLAAPAHRDVGEVQQYISWGESEGFHHGHLCSNRSSWFDLSADHVVPDVIITSMTRDAFHLAENELRASITNNLYGWIWSKSTSAQIRTAIVAWFRTPAGQEALKAAARRQGNDLLKLEPRALAQVQIPRSALPD